MMNNPLEQIDDLLEPQDWSFPVPISYGPGRLSEISSHCKTMGLQNPLIANKLFRYTHLKDESKHEETENEAKCQVDS